MVDDDGDVQRRLNQSDSSEANNTKDNDDQKLDDGVISSEPQSDDSVNVEFQTTDSAPETKEDFGRDVDNLSSSVADSNNNNSKENGISTDGSYPVPNTNEIESNVPAAIESSTTNNEIEETTKSLVTLAGGAGESKTHVTPVKTTSSNISQETVHLSSNVSFEGSSDVKANKPHDIQSAVPKVQQVSSAKLDRKAIKQPQAWSSSQSADQIKRHHPPIKTTDKTTKEQENNFDSPKGFNILPNRMNSPFFLKQLDISEDLIKMDPKTSLHSNHESHSASSEISPGKKSTRKARGYSMTSNDSESFSRSSSAADNSSANIKVAVRVRPLNDSEKSRDDKNIIEFPGNGIIWVETGNNQTKPFTFSTVLNENCNQQQLFQECGIIDLIDKAVDGKKELHKTLTSKIRFSCTAFAFGQTGSGKTHTITGPNHQSLDNMSEDFHGIVPRSFRYLFEAISKRPEMSYRLKASFLEVYNEKVKDLLNPSNAHDSLPVRWSSKKGFYVDNLFIMECENIDDLMDVLIEGLTFRQVGVNSMNDHSSRSHSMLTVYVVSEEVDSDEESGFPIVKHGKISFIDLAGSERVKETKTTGETLTESNNINKSLLTLGNCISALGDPKKRGSHIPFRESKLTKLLADSLGGDGFTLMIACISPSSHLLQDTMNTLRYANRAKNIKNKPVVKMDPKEQLLQRIKREIKLLKAENSYFRQQLGVPCSESQIIMTPTQINGQLTPNEGNGTLSPAIGTSTFSSLQSTRNNSSDEAMDPRATTAMYALGAKNGLYDMLQEYMNENESLKAENMQLHRSRATAQRQQEEMFRENERLAKKLDDLGRVMLSTPVSREHVRTWISSGSPSFGIFTRQPTDDGLSAEHLSRDREHVRFPPVRNGSYPNYVNTNDLSLEVEYEKQKLYQKQKEDSILLERKRTEELIMKMTTVASPKRTEKTLASSSNSHASVTSVENSVSNDAVHTQANGHTDADKNDATASIRPSQSKLNKEQQSPTKQHKTKPWKSKKKPTTVEKPSSYAARFAARSKLLTKQQQSKGTPAQSTQLQQQEDTTTENSQQNETAHYSNIDPYGSYNSYPPQMPMYSYGGGYPMQYPYMGMVPLQQQGMPPRMPMNVFSPPLNNNQLQLELESLNGQIRSEVQQKEKQTKPTRHKTKK